MLGRCQFAGRRRIVDHFCFSWVVIWTACYSRGCTKGVAGLLYIVLLTDKGLSQLSDPKIIGIALG